MALRYRSAAEPVSAIKPYLVTIRLDVGGFLAPKE